MKIIAHIWVSGPEAVEARKIADSLGIEAIGPKKAPKRGIESESWEKLRDAFQACFVTTGQRKAKQYIKTLKNAELDPFVTWDVRYTKREILECQLCVVSDLTSRPCAEINRARYDRTAGGCKACGSLAKFRGPFIVLGKPEDGSNIVSTTTSEWLVSPTLASRLRKVKDVENHLKRRRDAGPWKGWERLEFESTLPPMDPSSSGYVVENQCEVCRRDGYGTSGEEPSVLRYRASSVRKSPPISGTYELMASSRRENGKVRYIAQPELVVNADVARILFEQTSQDVRLDPVQLID